MNRRRSTPPSLINDLPSTHSTIKARYTVFDTRLYKGCSTMQNIVTEIAIGGVFPRRLKQTAESA